MLSRTGSRTIVPVVLRLLSVNLISDLLDTIILLAELCFALDSVFLQNDKKSEYEVSSDKTTKVLQQREIAVEYRLCISDEPPRQIKQNWKISVVLYWRRFLAGKFLKRNSQNFFLVERV